MIQNPGFPAIEEKILNFWKAEKIFEKSVECRPAEKDGKNSEFVFYDGPPFANGLPHYGHLLTGYVKDLIPRYQTMRGKKVERRFGWDCHGLPVEMSSEKELGISGRQQIQEYGIQKFNEYCGTSVLRYTKEWEQYVTRQARWVSFDHDYKTMDISYMESVIWAFKQLWDKGLVYEGFRVMPYSWACETPLSNFEIRMDNAYRAVQDPAVTIMFELEPEQGDPLPLKMLAWTTTPWTLPSNLALAVGAHIDYAIMEEDGVGYIIGEAVLPKYEKEFKKAKKIGSRKGSEFAGRRFKPLFPYFKDRKDAFRIITGDFVSLEEGTGVVHVAPGFGEDDQRICDAEGISLVCPVDNNGRFTSEVTDYSGEHVFDTNKPIIKRLKEERRLVRQEMYTHNYPHCWRTDTPLIYKAVESWYVRVTDFRDRMVQLNQQINWIPTHIKDGQFGKWLENARDWLISRNRFWGAPIPVWKSDDPKYPRIDVYGSLDELERDFGVRPTDLHRPFIDQLVRANPDDPTGKSMMRRVDEVLDCWMESGSMSFAQFHYPFENKEWFESHFPADFIVEYIAQTRGWFYTMMVMATALFDKPPFLNCVCHGVVLDENGQKLSKRLRNYPSPEEVFDTLGSDTLRWFLMSSAILKGNNLQIDREGKAIAEIVRIVLNPIWNAYYFFTLYANTDGIKAELRTDSTQLLDRYILSKTRELIEDVTRLLDEYDIAAACQTIQAFLGALNNWYIRRSRDRFWKSEKDGDKVQAYNTLYTVLHTLTKVAAPFLPLLTEEVYRGLTGELSVHLSDWPDPALFPQERKLVAEMDRVREICSVALSIREANNLRTRLPLKSLTVAGEGLEAARDFAEIIRDEINVKEVRVGSTIGEYAVFQLDLNFRKLGPRLGGRMKEIGDAARQGLWEKKENGIEAGGVLLEPGEYTLSLKPREGYSAQALGDNKAVVVLDIKVTKELEEEGLARDLVRLVQQARKEAGLHISDHIALSVIVTNGQKEALEQHKPYISEQTLADSFSFSVDDNASFTQKVKLGSEEVTIGIRKVR